MIAKLADAPEEAIPAYYPHSIRPWLVDHVNGAYLAATREVWQRISPLWLTLFNDTWNLMNDSQPPTDQLPLAVLLRNRTLSTLSVHMSQDYETVVPRQRKACVGGKVS